MEKPTTTTTTAKPDKLITASLSSRQYTESMSGWSCITPTSILWNQYITLKEFTNRIGRNGLYSWAYGRDVKKLIDSQLKN